jgi:RNA polymerase sigma-70 factor, ECF subfamily
MARTDGELVAAAQQGDRGATNELLERHQARVYRFGMKMCREEEDAKDVLQETLLSAARALPEFRGASSISTWLYTIARSFCIKKRRTSKFAPERVESLESQAEAAVQVADSRRGPEEDAAGHQLEMALDHAIAELDPMHREVLVLRDLEGLSAHEVGEIMGLTVEAVKSRLHRARVAVRARVAPFISTSPETRTQPAAGCRDVVELFSRRLEGEIDGSACAELEAHLEKCASCRGRCELLRATLTLCQRAGAAAVPPHVAHSVREALRRFLQSRASL